MINNVSFDSKFSSLTTVDQEFSDDSLELIQQWSQYYGDCFLKSEVAKLALSKKALEEFPFILSSFCDFCYSYYLQKPGQWMSDAVSDVLLNIMPRKVMADDAFFSQAALVLINFLTWMETEKYLSDIQAIKETMLAVEDDILKQAKNPNNWGLAKSLFSGMPLSKNTTSKQEELLCDDLSEKKQPRQAHEINTLDDIIDDLRYWTRGFPEAAINAAINQKAKITPMLIALLEETLQGYQQLVEQDFFGHLYALFLLASFREKKAFPLAIKIAILPDDWPDQLLGDTITEDFHRILASLYDGNLKALQSLIENPNVDHWSRNAALKTLLLLVKENIVERTWVVNYLKGLFHHPAFIEDDEASTCLVNAACDIYPEELYTDIQDAFRRNKVDTWSIDLKWVDEVIALGKEAALDRELYKNPHMTLIDDVIENMKWWACFQEETHKPMLPMHHEANNDKLVWSNEPQVSITYRRDTPKMGRNEPCPCGSGKKYKKCCLMQTVH